MIGKSNSFLLRIPKREFGRIKKLQEYALTEHKETGMLQQKKSTMYSKFTKDPTEINSPYYDPTAKPKELVVYSKQHPEKLDEKDTYMISYKRPDKPITPRYTIPKEAIEPTPVPFDSPIGSKMVEAIFVGAPNAGKSSLINRIIGDELTAASDKKGTTSDLKTLYLTKGQTQILLKDTPGATKANSHVNSSLFISKCWGAIPMSDLAIFIVDSVRRLDFDVKNAAHRLSKIEVDVKEKAILDMMANDEMDIRGISQDFMPSSEQSKVPMNSILVMNKVDLVCNRRKFNYLRQELEDIGKFDHVFNVSAKTGFGIEALVDYIVSQAKRAKWLSHPEEKTDQNEIEKVQEVMKQAVFSNYFYEVPYQVGVGVDGWTPKTNGELIVDYKLDVNRYSTKGILIGKNGRIIDGLRKDVEAKLSKLYQKPVIANIKIVVAKKYNQQ